MDPISIAIAFVLGFGARQIGLPPLVGFLVAGFLLHLLGVREGAGLQDIADLGVTLLLFTIGLKLKVKTLMQPEVWVGASVHAIITVIVFGVILLGLSSAGLSLFASLEPATCLLVAFALSFSSTVFAVKVLEQKGEMPSLHGRTTIGILVMQDVFAVVFLVFSAGKVPSPWALALVGLVFLRPVLGYLLDHIGHGELLPLFGMFAALTLGVALFSLVGLKPDLGALILGMLMADHKRANDTAQSLFAFKEIFLVGFFLSIGLKGLPSIEGLIVAVLLVLLVPFKVALFFVLLTRLRLRARSSLLASLSLANYSEFGLIVGAVGVSQGWISDDWLVVIAVALSISFIAASPLNTAAHGIYARLRPRLKPFETSRRHPDDLPLNTGGARVAIFGMGRVGTGAYDYVHEKYGDVVVGIDSDAECVAAHLAAGRNVLDGDATDSDFWERAKGPGSIEVALLAMPEHGSNLYALEQIKRTGFGGYTAAIAQYPSHAESLAKAGVDAAFNIYEGAGTGFAAHVDQKIAELNEARLARASEAAGMSA